MAQLVINNSYSRITGLTVEQEKALRKELSYVVGGKSSYFSGYGPKCRSLLDKRGEFPTGLLSIVRSNLSKAPVTLIDNRVKPLSNVKIELRDLPIPYEAQMTAVSKAVLNHRGTISMPTGTGKSLVIALIAFELKVKTLVVVPSLEIKKQLTESFISVFKDISWIDVENIDSKALKTKKDYGCLIIDESHHVAAKTYQKLNKTVWTNIYYRFFLTATPFRNDTEETLLFQSIAGDVIYSLSYKEAIKAGYIVPVEAYYIEIPEQKTEAYTYAEVYKELVVENNVRNDIITHILLKLYHKSTLCLVKEIKHGQLIKTNSERYHPNTKFVSGEDDHSTLHINLFNKQKFNTMIATTGIMGEGIDTKPCEYVIIAGLGKAKSQFMQQVGRAVRRYRGKESAKVIIFKDKSHKYLTRHFNAQCAILKEEYGVTPLKLEL